MGYQTSFGSPGGKMGGSPSLAPGYQFWGNNQVGTGPNPMWAQGYGANTGMPQRPMGMGMGMQQMFSPPSIVPPGGHPYQFMPPSVGAIPVPQGQFRMPPMGGIPPTGTQGLVGPPSAVPPPTLQNLPPQMPNYSPMGWGSGH